MGWSSYKCSDAGAISIPGYHKRAYFKCDGEWLCYKSNDNYTIYNLVVVVYQNDKDYLDVLTELYIRESDKKPTPIPRNIIERYLELHPGMTLVGIGGRCYIKGRDCTSNDPIRMDTLNDSVGVDFAIDCFKELLWQFLYPKVNSIESAKEVVGTYHRFTMNDWYMKSDRYTSSKLKLMEEIKRQRKKIERETASMDTCANESAEALNELSEKYGIEVDLSDE